MNPTTERKRGSTPHAVLHIHVLRGSEQIAQDVLDRPRDVSIGRSLRNTVVLADEHAPMALPLFHRQPTGFALHFTDDTRGSISCAPGDPSTDLRQLRGQAATHRHGYDLHLDEGASGRIEVGEETLAFEVVKRAAVAQIARTGSWAIAATAIAAVLFAGLVLRWLLAMPSEPIPSRVESIEFAPGTGSTVIGSPPQR